MDDIIHEFIAETVENLNDLDTALLSFEQNPEDKELLDKIFRTLHTIKGTCGFLGLVRLEKVAHTAETLLDLFRSQERTAQSGDVALILQSLDRIRDIIDGIQSGGSEPSGDDSALINALQEAVNNGATVTEIDGYTLTGSVDDDMAALDAMFAAMNAAPAEETIEEGSQEEDGKDEADAVVFADKMPAESKIPDESEKIPAPSKNDSAKKEKKEIGHTPQFLRVNVDRLESLMTMVSELVLTRNQLVQLAKGDEHETLSGSLQRLNFVVSELQDSVMKTRMQPIGNAWTKLPRIVHDVAHEMGKKIVLDMQGEETEIDRQVLELIKDPLMHMVRNSADHGIEAEQDRITAGKPATGTITLKAWHEGGSIIIYIGDDGKGMDPERIKRSAIQKGLATDEQMASLTDHQILQYIFQPGFSTVEKVTSVSGRGVGMDVVRTNIEKIGGMIELESRLGKGAGFTIRIPLTLAIVSALIIESEAQRYALPQVNVQELLKISSQGNEQIEWVGGRPVLRFRDRVLPLVILKDVLNGNTPHQGSSDVSDCYVLIVNMGTITYGLVVDRVFDTEEIVVKPVSTLLRALEVYAGNTILGDGAVIMILDPAGIIKAAHMSVHAPHPQSSDTEKDIQINQDIASLLLFRAGENERIAVPAFLVSRIEEFPRRHIEFSGGRPVLQYQGKLMDLHVLAGNVSARENAIALIFSDDRSNNAFGIIVDQIFDIVHDRLEIKPAANRPGFLGTAIIDGRATEILDVNHFSGAKEWYKDDDVPFIQGSMQGNMQGGIKKENRPQLLVVDDSAFFRNMLHPLLTMAGYAVTMVEGPVSALKLCDKGMDFDLIISDIEMEEMDGFSFVEKVKAETRWRDTPMVALSSHATPQDIAHGYEKGFSAYISKSNRDALLTTLEKVLKETQQASYEMIGENAS